MGKLNTAKLRSLVEPGVHGDGNGLYLQVRGPDRRTWIYRYQWQGKGRWMGLGSYPGISLAEAREAASEARKQVREGVDPITAKRATAPAEVAIEAPKSFAEAADEYIRAHAPSWRNAKHRQQWTNTLTTYVHPVLGHLPVAEIGTAEVKQVLEPIWHAKPETASRVRGRIETIFDYARAHGWRTGENPARWRGHLANLFPATGKLRDVRHHPALPWKEAPAFMALRFAILTAGRTNEAIGARWSEIDLDEAVWTIPDGRMKAGRQHRVPLSREALDVLAEAAKLRQGEDAPIFPGRKPGKPLSNMALLMLLRRMERADLTAHGFRSTFRDWTAEATAHQRDVAEAALAHVLGNKTEAAYQRGDLIEKRRRLMADWGAYCTRPMPDNVVILRGAG